MARRRKGKAVRQAGRKGSKNESGGDNARVECEKEALDRDVERVADAIRAWRDVEIAHTRTAIRLLRSYFNEKQLQTPVLQFFRENLPDLLLVKNEENGQIEVKAQRADVTDMRALLLQRLSLGCSNSMQPFSGFPNEAGRTSFTVPDSVLFNDPGPSGTEMLGFPDALHTPGASSQRFSIGTTPKTQRPPRPGEILLSVRGSPLGVYNEDNNMGTIQEIEEGSGQTETP